MMKRIALVPVTAALLHAFVACRAPQPRAAEPEPGFDPMTAVNTLLPAPADFGTQRIGSADYPIPSYAEHLAGVRICLDPGHGGDAHKRAYKRGPTGVREAEVNLRVARYLRELLQAAGAEVRLTRDADVDLSLADRAGVANDWPADLFISLHHNAVGRPETNFTTVWFHAGVDHRPSNLDLARYLCYGLYDTLALPQTTAVPLKSDQLMYESGFGVLRAADVTACLTETSFFTNPAEEQRLRDPEYNLLEAYGLFIGLAKYAAAGLPRAALVEPADGVLAAGAPRRAVIELDDGLRGRKAWGHERTMILRDSVAVRIDGEEAFFTFHDDGARYVVEAELPAGLEPGEHALEVQCQNMNKNSVLDPHFRLWVE